MFLLLPLLSILVLLPQTLPQRLTFPTEDSIIVLTQTTFSTARLIPTLAVFFYSNNRESMKLVPLLYQFPSFFKNFSPLVHIAKVNCEEERGVCDFEKIEKFPALKVYTPDGREILFDRPGSIENMASFIKRKVKLPAGNSFYLAKQSEVESFLGKNQVGVIFFGRLDAPEFKIFAAMTEKGGGRHYKFGHSFNSEVKSFYEISEDAARMVVFNLFREKNVSFVGEWKEKKLVEFINDHTGRYLVKLNDWKWEWLQNKNSSFLLLGVKDEEIHEYEMEEFQIVAKRFKDKLYSGFWVKDSDLNFHKKICKFLDADEEAPLTATYIIERSGDSFKKIKMEEEYGLENVMRFVEGWIKKLQFGFGRYVMIFENEEKFKKFNTDKDVVAIFNEKNKQKIDLINNYSEKMINNKNLIFASVRSSENHGNDIVFIGKDKHLVYFEGKLEEEADFVEFLKKYGRSEEAKKDEL